MNVAVIGAGYWGVNLVRAFRQLGVLRRVGDFSTHRLEALQQQHPDIRFGDSVDEVLGDQFVLEKPKPQPQAIDLPAHEPVLLEGRHFLEWMEKRLLPKTEGADARRVLKVLEASQRSASINGDQSNPALETAHA